MVVVVVIIVVIVLQLDTIIEMRFYVLQVKWNYL